MTRPNSLDKSEQPGVQSIPPDGSGSWLPSLRRLVGADRLDGDGTGPSGRPTPWPPAFLTHLQDAKSDLPSPRPSHDGRAPAATQPMGPSEGPPPPPNVEAVHRQTTSTRVAADQALQDLSTRTGIPIADLSECSSQAVAMVPEQVARRYQIVPLRATDGYLEIATANPFDIDCENTLAFATSRKVRMLLSAPTAIAEKLNELYRPESVIDQLLQGMDTGTEVTQIKEADEAEELNAWNKEASIGPVVRMVDHLLSEGIKTRASDIHIEPEQNGIAVRYRIDGVLRQVMALPRRVGMPLISRIKIMSRMDIADRLRPQDGRARVAINGQPVDLRVSTLPAALGEKVVIRILDSSKSVLELEKMGFNPDEDQAVKDLLANRDGVILVTGPTGSGKTTTLYSAIRHVQSEGVNIITVEDPVEYRLKGIVQVQVHEKAGLTFASALRSILRQDPDVVLVGEIRDRETAQIAVQASLTGHLVLSTLHTNDAPSAVARLMDIGIESYKIATAVRGVLAQRLMRKLCPACKDVALEPAPPKLQQWIQTDTPLYRAVGCPKCAMTGYRGRFAILEVLTVTPELEHLIATGETVDKIAQAARRGGMHSLWESGLAHVLRGESTIDELLRVVDAPLEMAAPSAAEPATSPPLAAPSPVAFPAEPVEPAPAVHYQAPEPAPEPERYEQPEPYEQPVPEYREPVPPYQQPAPEYQHHAPQDQPAPPYQPPAPPYQQPAPQYEQPAQSQQPAPPHQQPSGYVHGPAGSTDPSAAAYHPPREPQQPPSGYQGGRFQQPPEEPPRQPQDGPGHGNIHIGPSGHDPGTMEVRLDSGHGVKNIQVPPDVKVMVVVVEGQHGGPPMPPQMYPYAYGQAVMPQMYQPPQVAAQYSHAVFYQPTPLPGHYPGVFQYAPQVWPPVGTGPVYHTPPAWGPSGFSAPYQAPSPFQTPSPWGPHGPSVNYTYQPAPQAAAPPPQPPAQPRQPVQQPVAAGTGYQGAPSSGPAWPQQGAGGNTPPAAPTTPYHAPPDWHSQSTSPPPSDTRPPAPAGPSADVNGATAPSKGASSWSPKANGVAHPNGHPNGGPIVNGASHPPPAAGPNGIKSQMKPVNGHPAPNGGHINGHAAPANGHAPPANGHVPPASGYAPPANGHAGPSAAGGTTKPVNGHGAPVNGHANGANGLAGHARQHVAPPTPPSDQRNDGMNGTTNTQQRERRVAQRRKLSSWGVRSDRRAGRDRRAGEDRRYLDRRRLAEPVAFERRAARDRRRGERRRGVSRRSGIERRDTSDRRAKA